MSHADALMAMRPAWKRHGRRIDEGLDCYGAVLWLARRYGTACPDLSDLVRAWWSESCDVRELPELPGAVQVPEGLEQLGDVAWLWAPDRSRVEHVAYVEGRGLVVSMSPQGVRRDPIARIRTRLHSIWRFAPCSA